MSHRNHDDGVKAKEIVGFALGGGVLVFFLILLFRWALRLDPEIVLDVAVFAGVSWIVGVLICGVVYKAVRR